MKFSARPIRGPAALTVLWLSISSAASAQCNLISYGSGPAGAIPSTGTGNGFYPTVLPSAPLVSTVVVTGGSGTFVDAIVLHGLTHTYIDDLQFVLQSPSGVNYNLLNRLGGFSCDFSGDYTIVGSCSCTGYGHALPATCTGNSILLPGLYAQSFGTWISGTNGILNVPLEAIPAANGTWTLFVYDWAGGDVGALSDWDLEFKTNTTPDQPPAPPTCCVPEDDSTTNNLVTLDWTECSSNRATTHKVRYKKGADPTDSNNPKIVGPLSTTSLTLPSLSAGWWHWDVASSSNGTDYGETSMPCRFCIPQVIGAFTCAPGGLGGAVPSIGTGDGVWPTVLPSAPFVSTYNVVVPPGATEIVKVDLIGANHTWVGDLQIVLTDPTGANHNLVHRVGHTGTGYGLDCDLNGNYSIAPLARILCPVWSTSCPSSSDLLPGIYAQEFSSWPSGAFSIFNTPLELIPVTSGLWTLTIYDWEGLESGSLTSWQLCFGTGPAGPTSYCTPSTSSFGCNASISASAQPSVSLTTNPMISVAGVEAQKTGLLFYGLDNNAFTPKAWGIGGSSFLCVKPPTQRTGTMNSGGMLNSCTGSLALDWNAFTAGTPGAMGQPFLAGDKIYLQAWFRDPPAPKSTNLSDAIELTVQP
ncbi:MAG: hypothetical protein IT454_03935 [Planctomycetes bacterium]|nr:hypothetical protein [Planctomycetota bacterium]